MTPGSSFKHASENAWHGEAPPIGHQSGGKKRDGGKANFSAQTAPHPFLRAAFHFRSGPHWHTFVSLAASIQRLGSDFLFCATGSQLGARGFHQGGAVDPGSLSRVPGGEWGVEGLSQTGSPACLPANGFSPLTCPTETSKSSAQCVLARRREYQAALRAGRGGGGGVGSGGQGVFQ